MEIEHIMLFKNILKYAVIALTSVGTAVGIFVMLPVLATCIGILLLTGTMFVILMWAINSFDWKKTKEKLLR